VSRLFEGSSERYECAVAGQIFRVGQPIVPRGDPYRAAPLPVGSGFEEVGLGRSAPRSWPAWRPGPAILLKPRAAQAGEAMLIESSLLGPVLLLGEVVPTQCLFEGDAAAAHGSDHRGLAAHDPALGVWRRQVVAHRDGVRRRRFEGANYRAPPGPWRPRTIGRAPRVAAGGTDCAVPHSVAARHDQRRRV
jgi:hypothetical protein